MPIRVLFDATALCSAFISPGGTDMALLQLARANFFTPVITGEVVAEFVRNCRKGFVAGSRRVTVEEDDIDAFFEILEPLLAPDNLMHVRIGRAAAPAYPIRAVGGLWLVQVPQRMARAQTHLRGARVLALKDIYDFHVVHAALATRCDFICTYNSRDLPDGLRIGSRLEIIKPERLHRLLVSNEA